MYYLVAWIETSRYLVFLGMAWRAVWLLERAVVLAALAIVIVILVLSGFGVYAIHKMKPDWLRVDVRFWRALTFGLEIGRSGVTGKPRDEPHQLDAGDSNDDK
ncbi:MAG: hypothetical protein JO345_24030 [Streptosporangiaceae bacterium]|nr:hypothetical protein [Streptosporangiaceae bacterium]